jgi:cobalt/nickel transport system permease protein
VGAPHAHALYVHAHSPVHRLPPQCKVAAAVLFVLAVVATPREALWVYAVYGGLVAGVASLARVPPGFVGRRLVLETPFVLFAVFLPLVAGGGEVEVLGVGLSVDGLWAAWNVLAKATLGLATTLLLAATTEVPELIRGLERLRVPAAFTTIAAFMVRYADVIADEMRRMSIARRSRGHDPRWLWQVRAVAASAGALFIRSFERGERVHLAMLSRGYDGAMPDAGGAGALRSEWAASLTLPAVAALLAAVAWTVRP